MNKSNQSLYHTSNQGNIINVIRALVYKIQEQTNSNDDYVLLKSFLVSTLNEEAQIKYVNNLNTIRSYIPLQFYNPCISDQLCYQNMKYSTNSNQLKAYNKYEVTFIKYIIEKAMGCQHYVRGCQVQCTQCLKFYVCNYCHDMIEDHFFPRYDTTTVRCMQCDHIQPISGKCEKCNYVFGRYCSKCKLIDGLSNDGKPIFHCDKCNTCNVGFEEYSIHCISCNRCIQKDKYATHICINKQLLDYCPICLASVKNTQQQIVVLKCGHIMHLTCVQKLQSNNCPLCQSQINITSRTFQISKSQQLHPEQELADQIQ